MTAALLIASHEITTKGKKDENILIYVFYIQCYLKVIREFERKLY